MTTDIFIRTYHKDVPWLKYCLRSIVKYCTGFRQVVICIPENQVGHLQPMGLTLEKIVACKDYGKQDYLGQQISKLSVHKYTDAEAVLYVDSDCVFDKPVTPETFLENGKPVIYKTDYSKVGDAICWKVPTEKFIGQSLQYEYMRRLPLFYFTSTIANINQNFSNLEADILALPGFSEFNLIGAYAEINESDKYLFKDTDLHNPVEPVIRQKWSWGGLTDEIRKELNQLLDVNY